MIWNSKKIISWDIVTLGTIFAVPQDGLKNKTQNKIKNENFHN